MRAALVSVALLASNLTFAATPIEGWYTQLFGGYAYVPTNINQSYQGNTFSNASYNDSYNVGGSFGFKSNVMRYEGQVTYINANLKSLNVNNISQTGVSGYNNAVLGFANIYYDFPNFVNRIQPYLGVGIGYSWINAYLNSTGPNGSTQLKDYSIPFSYQGSAGLIYNFAETYALTVGYRYIATVNASPLGKMFQAQLASVGAIYRFDGYNYK